MLPNTRRIYALQDFTIEAKGGKWYFYRTARFGDKEEKRGPYSSLTSATLMIARHLKREAQKRDAIHKLPT